MTPYISGGRPHRLPFVELFDVGNVDLDGSVFALDNIRREWNKVRADYRHTLLSTLYAKLNIYPYSYTNLTRVTPSSTSTRASIPVAPGTLSCVHMSSHRKAQAETPNISIHALHSMSCLKILKPNSFQTTTSPHTPSGTRGKSPHRKHSRMSIQTIIHIAVTSSFSSMSLPGE